MRDLGQDLRYGLRRLTRSPGFTAAAVLTLALGIGATTAVFTLLRAVVFDALPYHEAERLVLVRGVLTRGEVPEDWIISWQDVQDLGAAKGLFSGYAGIGEDLAYNLGGGEEPVHVASEMVTPGYFEVLGVRPVVGRTFLAEEDEPGAAPVAILGHDLWRQRFGGDPAVVGKAVRLNQQPYTVVGVMPAGFRGLTDEAEIWLPVGLSSPLLGVDVRERSVRWLFAVARLAPGKTATQAQQELDVIFGRLAQEFPETNENFSLRVTPLTEAWFGDLKPQLLIALGAAGFVLLIACTNLASLLLVRAAGRQREMAMRAALGVGRGRLLRQLLTESVVLALPSAAVGLLLAWGALVLLTRSGAIALRSFVDPRIDVTVAATAVGVAILCSLVCGLAPAVTAVRTDLQSALRAAAAAGTGTRGRRRLQEGLVILEVGLALALLAGAGLMIKGFRRHVQTDLGLRPDRVLTLAVDLAGERFETADADYVAFARQLQTRLLAIPGVVDAALEGPGIPTGEWYLDTFSLEDRPDQEPVSGVRHHVSPGYFSTLGIPLLEGRAIQPQDALESGPPVVVISRALARRYWPQGGAIGKKLKPSRAPFLPWFTVAGVVGDVNHRGLGGEVQPDPDLYFSFFQFPARGPSRMWLLVRTREEPASLVDSVRQAVREVAPSLPVYDVRTMEERLARQTVRGRSLTKLMAALAGIALVLAVIGIYGLLAYTVTQRGREIGIRMALGSDRGGVVGLVVRSVLWLLAAGLLLGLAAAWVLNRYLTSLLYGVSPTDPGTLAATAVLLLVVALMAGSLPALRASRISPVSALRGE